MKHTILTIITEVDPSKKKILEELLKQISGNLTGNSLIPFPAISLLHFASFVISEPEESPPILIFENNFDGEVSVYLDQLLVVAGTGIHQIYQCSTGYKDSKLAPVRLKGFLTAHIVRPNAYHIGNVGRTSKVIKANQELREQLQGFLDGLFNFTKPAKIDLVSLRQQMQVYVKEHLNPSFQEQLPPRQTFLQKFMPKFWIAVAITIAATIVLGIIIEIVMSLISCHFPISLLVALLLLGSLFWRLRYNEEHDQVNVPAPSVSAITVLTQTEDQITQNHFANVTDIKSGVFRLVLLKVVLFAANLLARKSTKGKLSGIPSIHFAHWSIINNNKQLLFLSNYDGSWSSYLDDFIDKAASGLTGIWSNTNGFPYTRFLVLDGARDEIRFKAYARNHQIPSLVWYSAYRDLTVQNIDKDSKIRENLFTTISEVETKEWLKLF